MTVGSEEASRLVEDVAGAARLALRELVEVVRLLRRERIVEAALSAAALTLGLLLTITVPVGSVLTMLSQEVTRGLAWLRAEASPGIYRRT